MSVVLTTKKQTTSRVRKAPASQPDPALVRGRCPSCGDPLVSQLYYVRGKGYLIRWECWRSQGDSPSCDYQVVL